jgi:hypothetical protein
MGSLNKNAADFMLGGVTVPLLYGLLKHFLFEMFLPVLRTTLVGIFYYVAQRQGSDTIKAWLDNYREHHKKHKAQV